MNDNRATGEAMEATGLLLTCGQVALRVRGGVQPHHVRIWCDRALIPFQKVGRMRVVAERDLDAVRKVARDRGLLDEDAAT